MVEKTIITESDNSDIKANYYRLTGFMHGITRKSDIALLIKLDTLANQDGNFDLTAKTRDDICEELGLNKPNLSAAIKRLTDLNIIIGNKGSYSISSNIFINTHDDINKIKLNITLVK